MQQPNSIFEAAWPIGGETIPVSKMSVKQIVGAITCITRKKQVAETVRPLVPERFEHLLFESHGLSDNEWLRVFRLQLEKLDKKEALIEDAGGIIVTVKGGSGGMRRLKSSYR